MKTIKTFVKRHSLLSYFVLVFAISWGGMLIVAGPGGIRSEMALGFAYVAMLLGPGMAGILLTALVDGRAGLREFRSRLLKWRVGARWYAVALLTAPLLATVTLLALSLISRDFIPRIYTTSDKAFLVQFSIVAGLMVGILEELGWTGFAMSKMRQRYGVLGTGLIVGFMFAAWNFLVVFWVSSATSTAGALPPALFVLVILFSWLPAYRGLMVWLYDRTEILLLAMLMNTSLVAFWTSLTPLTITGMPLVTYYLVFTAALWIVIVAVALSQGGHLTRQPPPEAGELRKE